MPKKFKKVEPTFTMKHPWMVGVGGPIASGLGQAAAASLAESNPDVASALSGAVSLGTAGASGAAAYHAAQKWEEATGKPMKTAPSWWIRHPIWSGFLLGPIGAGVTGGKTMGELKRKGLIKSSELQETTLFSFFSELEKIAGAITPQQILKMPERFAPVIRKVKALGDLPQVAHLKPEESAAMALNIRKVHGKDANVREILKAKAPAEVLEGTSAVNPHAAPLSEFEQWQKGYEASLPKMEKPPEIHIKDLPSARPEEAIPHVAPAPEVAPAAGTAPAPRRRRWLAPLLGAGGLAGAGGIGYGGYELGTPD